MSGPVLYTARRRFWTWGDEDVVAQPQGSEPAVVVLRHATDARYLPTGHLVFMREGVLFGVGFDAAGLKVVGTPVPLVNGVVQALTAGNVAGVTGAGQFAVSTTGTLAWLPGAVILISGRGAGDRRPPGTGLDASGPNRGATMATSNCPLTAGSLL